MVHAHAGLGLKHRLRLRELAKYYERIPASSAIICTEDDLQRERPDHTNFKPLPPRLPADGHLTALAQLAALRLRCQRSFISLIDDKYQYILAEATQSISAFDSADHSADDGLIFGAQTVPVGYGICPRTMNVFLEHGHLHLDQPGNKASKDYVLVQDILLEPLFQTCPALVPLQSLVRYYLEVPLLSESGHILGSICVLDPQPSVPHRNDVSRLREVATLVVQHLRLTRIQQDHRRAERLLQGLSQFNMGRESISEWSKATFGQADIPNIYPEPPELSLKSVTSISQSDGLTTVPESTVTDLTAVTSTSSEFSEGSVSSDSQDNLQNPFPLHSITPDCSEKDLEIGVDPPAGSNDKDACRASTLAAINIRQTFSRAANLIRESMDLDVVCFLEVPPNERFKIPLRDHRTTKSQQIPGAFPSSTSDLEPSADSLSDTTTPDDEPQKPRTWASPSETICHRLGYSTRTKSSLASSTVTQSYLSIPANLLSKLTAKYPNGRIFHFDSDRQLACGEDAESSVPSTKRNTKDENISTSLYRQLRGARSLIFFPLYDNDRQQIYAGFLGYTSETTRALQENEVVYVSGFANSIMCEVMRLENLALDSVKSNFVSSISHELRSPLHGILGAAQLLSDGEKSPGQVDYVQMIASCARTLLDTMNQLLDYTKINHFTQRQAYRRTNKSEARPGQRCIESETYSLVTEVDILSMLEETTASITAGGQQKTSNIDWQSPDSLSADSSGRQVERTATQQIPVILNVPYSERWTFRSEAGSWRRIIMNLVSNSLKYTTHGYVEVNLKLHGLSSLEKKVHAELKVTDTGRGISEGYLKHRLYTSFAQEDNLSIGAGLGLSVVRQIVASLDGTIQVHSELGTGTEVIVQIPLESGPGSSDNMSREADLLAMTQARSFAFTGFDVSPSMDEEPTGMPTPHAQSLILMKEVLTRLLVDWFGMHPVDARQSTCVVHEPVLKAELEKYDRPDQDLLIINTSPWTNISTEMRHANFVRLSLPVGPIRMGHALKALLGARQNRADGCQLERPRLPRLSQLSTTTLPSATITQPGSDSTNFTTIQHLANTESSIGGGTDRFSQSQPRPQLHLESKSVSPTILLVDDNDINLRILAVCIERLRRLNLSYITASNGREALDTYVSLIRSGTPVPLVFMDISMPVMDGFTSTREIRAFEQRAKLRKTQRAKIVALTGLASAAAQREIDSSGFDLYLRKPVELKVVRALLEKHES